MSLQLLAKQMEAKGRKGDSVLVHMTPSEVAALQEMAESAGGSLSVNPETGLVEAFSLRNLLPAIVGGALMASGVGMPLAIAGGALTGGVQAKRNDQDFLSGALMGGLSAYGGAGLAGGLGAAGASAAGATAAPMTAAQGLSQAGQGIGALGSGVGGKAFMQGVGGVGGLAKSAGMAAAPMLMSQEQKMAEAPVDDEMYYTEYNPGQTGERSSTSTEALQFAGGYTPMESIKDEDYMKRRNRQYSAAQGGLMSLAEGGETAAPAEVAAPTASEAALAYLMGERSSSAGLPAMRAPSSPASNIGVGGDNMYAFDPATGTFLRNPNVAGATSDAVRGPVGTSFASSGGDSYQPAPPNPDFDTPEKQAAYYATRPNQANIVGIAQDLFGMTPLGKLQAYLDPEGVAASRATVQQAPADVVNRQGMADVFPGQTSSFLDPQQRAAQQAQNDSGGGGGGSGYDYSGIDSSAYDSYGGASGGIGASHSDYGDTGYDRAEGGLITLAKGGMASGGFVFPADALSALGNGSTDAGLRKLNAMMGGGVTLIKGKGDGLSDSIPTNIDGKQPARVADGEAYIEPEKVKEKGGAKKLYAMMDKVRAQAHGKTTQQRKVNPARVMA